MRYVAWDADLSTPDEHGVPERNGVRMRARQGAEWAIERLRPPRFPDVFRYLLDWTYEVRRGLGRDMEGLGPMTWAAVDAWARYSGNAPEPHEVHALFLIDSVMRNPRAFIEAA